MLACSADDELEPLACAVGKGVERVDGRAKVTGVATFACDTRVANVAHAVIVSAGISRGKVASIDVAAASKEPGVITVLTHENAPRLPGYDDKPSAEARVVQLLQRAEVVYDGQPIAVVVAETLEAAQRGAALVSPRYAVESADSDFHAALGSAYKPEARMPLGDADSKRGDAALSLARAPKKIAATYTTPIETHHPMELHGTIAVFRGAAALTIYDATPGVFIVKRRMAKLFGLDERNVRVISKFLGGGFGSKGSPWSHVALAAMAARVTGRAVKLSLDRRQMFFFVGHRPHTSQRLSLGAKSDGTLVAVRHEVTSHTSRFDEFTEPSAKATRMLYACGDVETSHRLVRLDTSTPTFTRAPGEASGSFALECAMDELAVELRMDPSSCGGRTTPRRISKRRSRSRANPSSLATRRHRSASAGREGPRRRARRATDRASSGGGWPPPRTRRTSGRRRRRRGSTRTALRSCAPRPTTSAPARTR